MIPILFEKDEWAFDSNGLGRLIDCIECKVTEELNGIYECDFSYPVTGQLFSDIVIGRSIAITHDDTGDVQYFDIVSYSKPIDGIVTFHAVHVSYRLGQVVTHPALGGGTIDSAGDALAFFTTGAPITVSGHFAFLPTDMSGMTGFMASTAEDIPRSIRQFIGGVEGSFLDTYGGEITWDKFNVKFQKHRGQKRPFAVRYGVNLIDYNEQTDGDGIFTMAVPYWKDNETVVVGGIVSSGLVSYDGRDNCAALDLSERFENEPAKQQLEDLALEIMRSGQTNLPKRTIEVEFIRLQDLEEYAGFDDLLVCELGDSLDVIFPAYNVQSEFRIVKVVWDALTNRFESMTLGSLQTTLAEALGAGQGSISSGGGGGGISSVTVTPIVLSGTKIATIDVDGTETDLYAPAGGGGTGAKIFYGTCGTAAGTAAKVVTCPTFTSADLEVGTVLYVDFTNANTVASPTLNVNSTGAIAISRYGTTAPSTSAASSWNAGAIVCMIYDGTYWTIEGWLNTTYSSMTVAEYEAGTGTTARLITPARLKAAIEYWAPAGGGGSQTVWYGACPTAENTAAKVVTTTSGGFSLTAGNIVFVTFDNRLYTANTTLNVDGTGAVTIKQNGGAPLLTMWGAGETVGFVYDGTNFELIDRNEASTTEYGLVKLSSSTSDGYANVAANGTAVKAAYDLADSKSEVTWTQTQTTGTKIAEIDIDGTTTDVYAPTGGGGGATYTATAPISISNANVISHDLSDPARTADHISGTYNSTIGYYMPYIEFDDCGHITDAYNLGQTIPANTSSSSGSNPQVLAPYSWAAGLRSTSNSGFTLSAGSTTQSQTIQTDAQSAYINRTNFRIADVQAYDMTTFEPVIVDWSCDKVFSAGGTITVTVSIASAWPNAIRWFPILTYATAGM